MKRYVLFAALVLGSFMQTEIAATNIDEGFTEDGTTTYCQGINADSGSGALDFTNLLASNTGRCPVGVTITATPETVHPSDVIEVTWKTYVNKDVTGSIFPNAIDTTTGLPGAVTASYMKACTAGTNCATVFDPTLVGASDAATGAYGSDGTKTLQQGSFTFTDVGTYIIIGIVQLPGDASLNISASEYLAIKSVTVVAADVAITPTPTPSSSASASDSGSGSGSKALTPVASSNSLAGSSSTDDTSTVGTVAPAKDADSSGSVEYSKNSSSSSGSNTSTEASNSKSFFSSNTVLLSCVLVGCFIAFVMGFAFVMRRRKDLRSRANKYPNHDNSLDSTRMGGNGHTGGGVQYVQKLSSRNMEPISHPASMSMSGDDSIVVVSTVRGSEMNESPPQGPPSDLSSLPSEKLSEGVSMLEEDPQNNYLQSFDWKDSQYEREMSSASAPMPVHDTTNSLDDSNPTDSDRGYGYSMASDLSDLTRNTRMDSQASMDSYRHTRMDSQASVDSYAFRPSRVSTADSYVSANSRYSHNRTSSRISEMSN